MSAILFAIGLLTLSGCEAHHTYWEPEIIPGTDDHGAADAGAIGDADFGDVDGVDVGDVDDAADAGDDAADVGDTAQTADAEDGVDGDDVVEDVAADGV